MKRRTGDDIAIAGDYQMRAITEGNPVQRFWHHTKKLVIAQCLPPAPRDLVLDVGCGSGVIASFLGESGATIIGIDGNPDAIEFARNTFGSENVSFSHGLVDEAFSLAEPADKIYCAEVVEHIHHEQAKTMLEAFREALKPDGKVLITTPNYRSLWPVIEWTMDRLGLAPAMASAQHVTHYDLRKMQALCAEAGFSMDQWLTVSCIAPWLAPFSWRLATRMHHIEAGNRFLVGAILVCVLSRA